MRGGGGSSTLCDIILAVAVSMPVLSACERASEWVRGRVTHSGLRQLWVWAPVDGLVEWRITREGRGVVHFDEPRLGLPVGVRAWVSGREGPPHAG